MFIKLFNEHVLTFLKTIETESIDLIYTDPPYGLTLTDSMFDSLSFEYPRTIQEANDLYKKYIVEFERVLKPNSDCYILLNYENYPYWFAYTKNLCKDLIVKNCIVWYRTSCGSQIRMIGGKNIESKTNNYQSSHVFIMYLKKGNRYLNDCAVVENFIDFRQLNDAFLERMKSKPKYVGGRELKSVYPMRVPEEVIEPFIINSSNEGDVVLDPFMGQGSVGKVCLRLNRSYLGNDINIKAYDLARKYFEGTHHDRYE